MGISQYVHFSLRYILHSTLRYGTLLSFAQQLPCNCRPQVLHYMCNYIIIIMDGAFICGVL
jgi:hypothetical protein